MNRGNLKNELFNYDFIEMIFDVKVIIFDVDNIGIIKFEKNNFCLSQHGRYAFISREDLETDLYFKINI